MNALRTTPVLLLLALLALPARAAAPSEVDAVTVFADRAEVTRRLTVPCTGRDAEARFEGLPTSLDVRTLRAEASGAARALGTTSRVVSLDADLDARAAEVREALEKVQVAEQAARDQAAALDERRQAVTAYGAYLLQVMNEDARAARPDPKRWQKALDLLDGEREDAAAETVRLAAERRELARRRNLLERRLAHLGGGAGRQAREVTVGVACRGADRTTVRLSYVVPGATWRPEYDLRYRPGKGRKVGPGTVELTVSAVIRQATGEDWEDARIVLSTARPRLGTEAPKPAPLWVDGRKEEARKVLVQATERRARLRGPAGEPPLAGPASAALDDRGQSFVLKLPRRATVRADGRPYWIPVDRVTTKGEAALVAVPKLAPWVYQVVRFDNPAAYPLLAGPMHVHRRGAYVGDVTIEHRAPGEPLEVSLGTDGELEVERIDLLEQDRRPGFLSGTKHLDRAYRLEVESHASRPLTLELRENVPVSKVEDVKVELLPEKTTAGYELDPHRGFVTWKVRLASGEKKHVDLGFVIHLPSSWEVR